MGCDGDAHRARAPGCDAHDGRIRGQIQRRRRSRGRSRGRAAFGEAHRPRYLIRHARLSYRLYIPGVVPVGHRVAAEVQRVGAGIGLGQRHQILAVPADIGDVVVDGVLVSLNAPCQGIAGCRRRNAEAVVDSRFDFRSLFVIVPRHQLQRMQLFAGVIELVAMRS